MSTTMSHRLSLAAVLSVAFSSTATAALMKLEVTYSNISVVNGPICSVDELPVEVCLTVWFGGRTAWGNPTEADVIAAEIAFGDAAWTAEDLDTLAMFYTEKGGPVVVSLTYMFNPIDTQTVLGIIILNFPLTVEGTCIANGEAFQYVYADSVATVNPDACQSDCGDANGIVGIVDFLTLLSQWGMQNTSCDIDNFGVGITDFLELLANWGPCPQPGGACCLPASPCLILSSADCTAVGGTYGGDGTACPTSNCCFVHAGGGCDDGSCSALVVQIEPSCAQTWHSGCVSWAQLICGLCGPCSGP